MKEIKIQYTEWYSDDFEIDVEIVVVGPLSARHILFHSFRYFTVLVRESRTDKRVRPIVIVSSSLRYFITLLKFKLNEV